MMWIVNGCTSTTPATLSPQPPATTPVATTKPTVAPTPTAEPAQPVAAGPLPTILEHLRYLEHASFRLDGPPTIYFDPANLRGEVIPADVILISHDHSDHYAPAILKQISTAETVIITNETVADKLANANVAGEIWVLKPGEVTAVGDVEIETVPAYNIGKSYHPKEAGGLGFIVAWGGERLYFAGDTSRIPEMQEIDCDVALLPIDGTYTMNIQEAAQAAADIGPKVVVPMHMRNANPEEFRDLCNCTVVILK
jgi:L-ascorbate metabolism protein UlaG (beta-lactamase superfamily)